MPRFRAGYFRDCSARPPELMHSEETDVSSEIVPWSPSASSILVHRQRHRYEHTQPPSVWIHMRCSPRVRNSASSENIAGILQDVGREGAHDVFVWSGRVVCTSRARSPAKQCFETADFPRHTCFGHHPTRMSMRGGAQRSFIMSATGPA